MFKMIGFVFTDQNQWLLEDLEYLLDTDDSADLNLQDFSRWLLNYGFDLIGTELKPKQEKQSAKEKTGIDPTTYQEKPEDHFRGVKTIFNSELAALAAAERIYRQCEADGLDFWLDPDFGSNSEDPYGGKSLFYDPEEPPSTGPVLEEVKW